MFAECQLNDVYFSCYKILFVVYCMWLDLDECSLDTACCNQGCTNTEGGYNCTCSKGYALTTRCTCTGRYFTFSIITLSCIAHPKQSRYIEDLFFLVTFLLLYIFIWEQQTPSNTSYCNSVLEDNTLYFSSQENKFLLFCPPRWRTALGVLLVL